MGMTICEILWGWLYGRSYGDDYMGYLMGMSIWEITLNQRDVVLRNVG
jgi:hypothetical protein